MDDELEMRPAGGSSYKTSTAIGGMSTNMIIVVACIIGGGLAIGLGVGLGVGLNNIEYVFVTEKPTSTKPATTAESTTTMVISTETTPKPTTTVSTTPVATTTTGTPMELSFVNHDDIVALPKCNNGGMTAYLPVGFAFWPLNYRIGMTFASHSPSSLQSNICDGPWLYYRLPDYIIPSHNRLTLQLNMTTDDYTGTNEIHFKVMGRRTKYVLFHAHSTLEIRSVKLMDGTNDLNIVNQFRWPDYEFYVVEAEDELIPGEYFLSVDFYNSLVNAIAGIYKSTYVDPDTGEEKGVVASHMEPTDARRGYPCFDEPAMKIRYLTIVIHEQMHTALSNMPVDYTEDLGNGLNRTVFQESPPMSTYLGCFVVAELDYKEEFSARGIPLRIYGSKYQIDRGQVDYALQVTAAIFDKFEDLFGVNYTLPKFDQIAIPNFGIGAMENWGLVTFRETNLLWDLQDSSTYNKQRVAAVVAHELAHQWFGNIVTMKWWDNGWLKEGFASYLEYIGLEWAEPEWIVNGHFVVDDLQTAMSVDASTGSHSIVVNVSSPSQITEVFDTITYQKGSSILRMMNDIFGDELFFGGLNRYLNDFAFTNADEADLWNSVQAYINDVVPGMYDVKDLMDPWVQQLGFPIISVETVAADDETTITQEIMLTDADPTDLSNLPESEYGYKWNVKLKYFTQTNSAVQEEWLNRNDEHGIDIPIPDYGTWTKFNADAFGYYRVNYDADVWNALATQLQENSTVFNEVDRTSLLDDAMNLAPAGKLTYSRALNMTTYLEKEESYFVWRSFSRGSEYIQEMLKNTDDYTNFQEYYLTKVRPIARKVGWNASEGTHEEKRMRPYVLDLALSYGDEEALVEAIRLFGEWRNKATYIHPDVRELVYRYGILGGTVDDWEYMLERYKGETVAGERTNLIRGLAATEDVALIDRLLEYTRDPDIIKEQDFYSCITYISYTVNGNKMAWSWVRVNWDWMVDRFGIEDRYLGRLVPSIVQYYNTPLQKWEVESFFEANPEAGAGELNRKNALIKIDLNIAWMTENAGDIGQWLAKRVGT